MINRRMPKHAGEVGILNVGDGDTKLSFDPNNPAERIRAARIVADMIRRGYALLVETEPGSNQYVRAIAFREDRCEYVIADFDPITAAEADTREERQDASQQDKAGASAAPTATAPAPARRSYSRKSIDAGSRRAVAVAPSAGG